MSETLPLSPITLTLLLKGDIALLSPNRLPLNRMAVWRMEQHWKEKAAAEWLALPSRCRFPGRVRVSFCIYRWRKLDPDNARSSRALKMVIDGLKGKAFPDDTERWVEMGPVTQVSSLQYRRFPAVSVTLEGID